jgi:hypothetical protein
MPPAPQQGGGEVEEQVLLELANVEMTYGGRANPEGVGALRVSSRRVVWEGAAAGGQARFEAAVPTVTLHAISKDPSSFPKPCLYCQVRAVGLCVDCALVRSMLLGYIPPHHHDGRTIPPPPHPTRHTR